MKLLILWILRSAALLNLQRFGVVCMRKVVCNGHCPDHRKGSGRIILKSVNIGDGDVTGAGPGVSKDDPSGALVVRPLRIRSANMRNGSPSAESDPLAAILCGVVWSGHSKRGFII